MGMKFASKSTGTLMVHKQEAGTVHTTIGCKPASWCKPNNVTNNYTGSMIWPCARVTRFCTGAPHPQSSNIDSITAIRRPSSQCLAVPENDQGIGQGRNKDRIKSLSAQYECTNPSEQIIPTKQPGAQRRILDRSQKKMWILLLRVWITSV
eukprot:scaffold106235_cov23-Tisochrysis_lutea.AAC.1